MAHKHANDTTSVIIEIDAPIVQFPRFNSHRIAVPNNAYPRYTP